MKKVFLLLIAAGGAFTTFAQSANDSDVYKLRYQADVLSANRDTIQTKIDSIDRSVDEINRAKKRKTWVTDMLLSRWVLDINALGGPLTENITTANTNGNYLNEIGALSNTGKLSYSNGMSYGGDLQVGYFLGKKAHWGIGTGVIYMYQQGTMKLDQFNVQYENGDANGNVFRQWTSADAPVKENLNVSNWNIPLFLKYKNRFTKHSGFTADAGIIYNVQLMNMYKTNATFDYQAYYAWQNNLSGNAVTVYDNNYTPNVTDLAVTKAAIAAQSGAGSVNGVLNNYHSEQGYNVGLNVSPNKNTGTTYFTTGTVGFMIRPAYSFYVSNRVAINLGAYYLYQAFNNNVKPGYMLTNKLGDYNSVTNSISTSVNQTYGVSLGLRIYLGNYHQKPAPLAISSDVKDPTCGSSDGQITIHNLTPGEPVTIHMLMDGNLQPTYTDSVSEFGTVMVKNLAAGDYSNIVATVGGVDHNVPPVTLASSPIGYYSESSTNPLSFGACNGAIRMHGLKPGLTVNVKYTLNGTAQPNFTGTIGQDGTVSMTGLCAGNYTGIVVNVLTCTINGSDVTLTNPAPVQPQYYEEDQGAPRHRRGTHVVEDRPDVSQPILFDVGKTIIHEESYSVLDEAIQELNDDDNSYAVIDGYTDNTGGVAFNQALSQKRSDAVKYYLTHRGISGSRLQTVGHGINDPIADNSTAEGRQKNRRVVISLKTKH